MHTTEMTKKTVSFVLCIYLTFLCIFPSQLDAAKILIAGTIFFLFYTKNLNFIFFQDSTLYAIVLFCFILFSLNLFGIGSAGDTLKFSSAILIFTIGKLFASLNRENMLRPLLIGSATLAVYISIGFILPFIGITDIGTATLHKFDLQLTFRNVSRTGLFMAVALQIVATTLVLSTNRRFWMTAVPVAFLLLNALILAGRRMTLAAVLAATSLLLMFRKKFLPLGIGIAVILLLILGLGQAQRFSVQPNDILGSASLVERQAVWYAAWHLFKENPVLGCGFRTFKEESKPYVEEYREMDPNLVHGDLEDAHNIFLHVMAENGVVGLAFFLFLFYKGIFSGIRLIDKNIAAFSISMAFIIFFLHFQLHMHLYSTNIHGLFFLFLGFSQGMNIKSSES